MNISKKLDSIVRYLGPRLDWANCHMVNYLTDNLWERFVPVELRDEIQTDDDVEVAIDVIWGRGDISGKFFHLKKFIEESRMFVLTNLDVLSSLDDFSEYIGVPNNFNNNLSVKEFMSEKKCHEVDVSAAIVAALAQRDKLVVVDAGDGKGYLSSRVALQHKLNVIGIDSNPKNTEGAIKRITRLEKAWNGLTKRATNLQSGQKLENLKKITIKEDDVEHKPKENSNYQTITQFITPDIDLNVLCNKFPGHNGICLTGLHTCGNLATTCIKLFKHRCEVRALFNVGCCYHFIEEQFEKPSIFLKKKYDTPNTTVGDYGFPLSKQLNDEKFSLGRNARMLSCQSVERTQSSGDLPCTPLFYRALFEVLMRKKFPEIKNSIQVGRIKKYSSFADYARKCFQKSNVVIDVSDEELDEFCQQYQQEEKLLRVFYLLRMTLAPIVEGLILLDRVLYLKEKEDGKVFLIQLFDPVVSPRCYGIISVK